MTRRNARMTRRTFAGSAVAVSAGLAAIPAGRAVLAQDASPVPSAAPALPEGALVVADGLRNPRFIAISDAGVLYVTRPARRRRGDDATRRHRGRDASDRRGHPGGIGSPAGQAVTRGATGDHAGDVRRHPVRAG